MPRPNLLALLTGGDRRSIGNSIRVSALALAPPGRFVCGPRVT